MDSAQFSKHVLGCEQKLFRIAYLTLGGYEGTEDAVQETLLKAWKRLPSLREPAYFDTWLIRILINECKDQRRKVNMQRTMQLSDAVSVSEPPDTVLRDALSEVDLKYRIPIVLHHLEGYKVNEVAQMMRLTNGMVRWRLERGMALLRVELTGEVSK